MVITYFGHHVRLNLGSSGEDKAVPGGSHNLRQAVYSAGQISCFFNIDELLIRLIVNDRYLF